MTDMAREISLQVQAACETGTPLNIIGAGTKSFLGQPVENAQPLDVTNHSGIIEYDPAELVLVARAGTPLQEIENLLAAHDQILGFEPPFVNKGATLGGAVAAGLAGPRRAWSGAVRDFILGAGFINGKGEIITAGGKVMKNVAGFDLFRPMARSMGTLGVLLDVSLRVIPAPEAEMTLLHEENNELAALEKMNLWAGKTQTISGTCWDGETIRTRLSGSEAGIRHGRAQIGGQELPVDSYWQDLNNFELDFFQQRQNLWRISVAPMSAPMGEYQHQLIDWRGAQRWIKSDAPAEEIRSRSSQLGGHAECFSQDQNILTFHPLESAALVLQQRFKAAFDPAGILNPGRLYPGL